jgi:NTE family protein
LGSGSARGWAHIGVIRELEQAGVRPDFICGTSIGALVGAAYAAGELDGLEQWVLSLGRMDVASYFDISLSGGLVKGDRLARYVRQRFADQAIEQLPIPFAAVATSLQTGREIWLRRGSTFDAVRASIAVPGLFAPVVHEGLVLVDGGLVNPIPVSLARGMGADVLIAVDLGSDILGRRMRTDLSSETSPAEVIDWIGKLQEMLHIPGQTHPCEEPMMPSIVDVLASSIDIMQVRIARSRLAGEPPDLLIAPRLSHLRLLDFHRAKEAIEEGHRAVERVASTLAGLKKQVL